VRAWVVLWALLLSGCAGKAVVPESLPDLPSWSVDRSTLPGGTLRVLPVAVTHGPENTVVQGGGNALLELPVYVYVFEHPTHGPVLIDAGFPRRTSVDVADYPGKQMANLLGVEMEPGSAVVDRLGEIGRSTDDVEHIVITHMHADHIGGVEDFPGATLHVGEGEWESAYEAGFLGKPDVSPFDGRTSVDHLSFGDTAPYGPFEGHRDLFGDGSVVVMPAGGHTPGHVAVLVNLAGGSYLIAGDCAWVDRHWVGPEPKGALVRGSLEYDWRQNWGNQWRIHAFAKANPNVVVLAGHEPATGDRVPLWPTAIE
jgi:glyoxylase-like metal-dependent hydrolase (beta-lactamase superfamily II)